MLFSFSDERIEEFQNLVAKEFGEPVSFDDAQVMANNLLQLYDLLLNIGQQS